MPIFVPRNMSLDIPKFVSVHFRRYSAAASEVDLDTAATNSDWSQQLSRRALIGLLMSIDHVVAT